VPQPTTLPRAPETNRILCLNLIFICTLHFDQSAKEESRGIRPGLLGGHADDPLRPTQRSDEIVVKPRKIKERKYDYIPILHEAEIFVFVRHKQRMAPVLQLSSNY
jgi:hypothetical protein